MWPFEHCETRFAGMDKQIGHNRWALFGEEDIGGSVLACTKTKKFRGRWPETEDTEPPRQGIKLTSILLRTGT